MDRLDFNSGAGLGSLRKSESVMEIGLAVAAAGFTVAIWLLSDTGTMVRQDMDRQYGAVTHVTFPTVVVSAAPLSR